MIKLMIYFLVNIYQISYNKYYIDMNFIGVILN